MDWQNSITEVKRRPAQLCGAVWVGVLLIGIGVLFYLDSIDVIDFFLGIIILMGTLILIGGVIR